MAESVASALEADAKGEIAEIYADIRKVLGTSVVNLIWRNLATMPGALEWTWSTVRPLYLGAAPLHAEAVRRTIALPDWPSFSADTLLAAGIDQSDQGIIRNVLESYQYTNALALVVLSALLAHYEPRPADTVTAVAAAPEVSRFYFFYWFPRQLQCFLFGIMLFKWQAERPLPAPAFGPLLCLASVILMVVVPFLEGVKYALPLGPQTTYGLVFALFICSLMSWKSSPLVNPVIIWIGKVSYSAYFIHFAVLYYFAVPRVSGNAVLDYAIFYAIAVSITVALSSVTYWLIEQPMIRLGGRVVSQPVFSRQTVEA